MKIIYAISCLYRFLLLLTSSIAYFYLFYIWVVIFFFHQFIVCTHFGHTHFCTLYTLCMAMNTIANVCGVFVALFNSVNLNKLNSFTVTQQQPRDMPRYATQNVNSFHMTNHFLYVCKKHEQEECKKQFLFCPRDIDKCIVYNWIKPRYTVVFRTVIRMEEARKKERDTS